MVDPRVVLKKLESLVKGAEIANPSPVGKKLIDDTDWSTFPRPPSAVGAASLIRIGHILFTGKNRQSIRRKRTQLQEDAQWQWR
jgi:hypothetical protein